MDCTAISIQLNGSHKEITAGTTVEQLISEMHSKFSGARSVFINEQYVPQDLHGTTELAAGDSVYVYFFMGGG